MKDIKIHDFEKSKKYNPSQLRFLTTYAEAFAKSSSLQLQYELKNQNSMKMVLKSVHQEPYTEFIEKLEYDSVIVDFSIGDDVKNLIFSLDKKVALILVDCLLGSNGQVKEDKDLTEIDIEILNYMSNTLFKKTRDFLEMSKANVEDIYTNKAQYRNSSARGSICVSEVDVYLNNEIIGSVKLCVPYVSVEKVIDILMAKKTEQEVSKTLNDNINKEVLNSIHENRIEFDIVAELGSAMIDVRQLLSIDTGDVLMLDKKNNEDIEVLVGGHKAYLAKPGKVGSNNAIIITDSIEGEVIEDDKRENE